MTTISGIGTSATTLPDGTLGECEQDGVSKKFDFSIINAAINARTGQSTGILSCGAVTGVGGTTIDVAMSAVVFMDYSDPENPVPTIITPTISALTITNIASQNSTYVAFDSAGSVVQQATPFTNTQRRTLAPFANIVHSNRTTINLINPMVHVVTSVANQLIDCMYAFGKQNLGGNLYSANGANLKLDRSAGLIFAVGSNYFNDVNDPHRTATSAATALTFRLRLADGVEGADTDTLDPTEYEPTVGTATTLATANTWQVMRLNTFVSGATRIQRGQVAYSSLANAISGYLTEPFVEEANIHDNGLLRGWLFVKRSTTDLSDPAQAHFIERKSAISGASGAALTSENIEAALGFVPEASIGTGTTAQYWRGDKTFVDFATDVRSAVLTGLSTATATAVTAANTVLEAIGKLQAQINSNVSNISTNTTNIATNTSNIALKADKRLTTNTQTASYTAVLADAGKEVIMDVASGNNFTVPPSSSVVWVAGDQLTVFQKGAGLTTIVAGSGVTINNRHATLKMLGQYSTVYLRYRGSDVWAITGELSEV